MQERQQYNEYKSEVVTVKIDKNVLKRALKDNDIPGARLTDGKRGLLIK